MFHSLLKFGGIGILLATHEATPTLVLIFYAMAPVVAAVLFLLTICRPVLHEPFRSKVLVNLYSLIKWYLAAITVGSITSRMDLFLVSTFSGSAQAGLFSAAQITISGFTLVGTYLGVVFAPRIIPLWRSGRLAAVYKQFQFGTVFLSILIYAVALFAVNPIITFLLPDSFAGTSHIILLLLPSALVALINNPWTVPLLLFSRPKFLVALDAIAFIILIILYRGCIQWQGAAGAATVTTGYALFKTVTLQVLGWRTLRNNRILGDGSTPESEPAEQ